MLYKMELPSGWIVESFDVTPGINIAGGLFINQDLVQEVATMLDMNIDLVTRLKRLLEMYGDQAENYIDK